MGVSAVQFLLVVVVLVAGAVAGPARWQASDSKCSTKCPDSEKFRYQTGWTYEYSYEAETRTTVAGAAEDTASVSITATARITVLDNCDMALRLSDVKVKRSDEEDSKRMVRADDMSLARNALEAQALRFAFYDGVVGSVCPDEGEELWALNVKRGVLSAFQNSMRQLERDETVQESDVAGQCPTHYRVTQQGWKSLTVSKVKDVLGCTHRHGTRTSFLSSPYTSPNSLQSLPLMKTSHECTQDISKEEAIVERSSCQEVHVFRPFSKGNSGAVTEASHTLVFLSKAKASFRSDAGPVDRRSTLLFEHRQGVGSGMSVFMDAKSKLKELCQATKVDIRPQVPSLFAELVQTMRDLDYTDLQELNRQLDRKRICDDNSQKIKDFFRDALPMVATGASLRTMTGLLTSEELSDAQATFWITSLAFVSNPTKDMISAVQPLLKDAKRQQDALLAVSAMVNNYCEHHEEDCGQQEEIRQVMETLADSLGPQCQVQEENLIQVLQTLRAIGNIGRSEVASFRLQECFTHSDNPVDVRVAALDAYRRMPCTADRNNVMEVFLRHSDDSELRIAAYLTVMQCPSQQVLDQVRQALMDEEVNQVGSFVWTHLTNLLETDSPHKQAVREILENDLLQKEFREDRRKFSRNTEISYFSSKFNFGGTFDSNLIWSQKSFLPRSAMMNLTVDMFGNSVNLLELGGRVQGLEDWLQSTILGSAPSGKDGGYGKTDAVKNGKLVKTKKNFGDVKDDFRGQLYMRIFGNELAFATMDRKSLEEIKGGDSLWQDLGKRLIADGDVSFTHSAVIMDTTLIIPTVAGLPLNLTVNGSASLEVQASQKMNFKKINAKSKAFEIEGKLQPSAAVELASSMMVDAMVSRVGLRMTSRLHTSTAMQGRMELARGQILSVEVDTPRDTLEILDFQSKFYIVHDEYEKEQAMLVPGRLEKRACSGQPLAKVVGVEMCASLSFPNATSALSAPYFPLTGPTSFSLTLTKHDVHTGYKLLAKQIQTKASVITQVALDTPGSKVDRAISLGYVANRKDNTLDADLLSPWKKVTAKMSMKDTKKLLAVDASVTIDSEKSYTVHAEMARDTRKGKELKPSLEVKSKDVTLLSAKGSLDYRENKSTKLNFLLNMKDLLKKPISFDFSQVKRGNDAKLRYKNNVKLSSQFATVKGVMTVSAGSAQKRPSTLAVKSKLDYNLHFWPMVKRNMVNLGLKFNDRSTKALSKYGINMNLDSKHVPDANLAITGEVSHKKTLTKMSLKVRHGPDAKTKGAKGKEAVLEGFVNHKLDDRQAVVNFDLKGLYPEKKIEYQLKGKHEHNKKELEDYLTLRYAKGKSMDAHLKLTQEKKEMKYSGTFDLSYPKGDSYTARVVKLNADFMEKAKNQYVLSALVSPQKGEKHSMVVSVHRPTATSLDVSSELDLHKRPPINLDLSGNYGLRNMSGKGKLTFEGDTYKLAYTSDIQTDAQYANFTARLDLPKRSPIKLGLSGNYGLRDMSGEGKLTFEGDSYRLAYTSDIQTDAPYANFSASLDLPKRRVTAAVEGGRDTEENVMRGKVEALWDANNDPKQKFGVTLELADKAHPKDTNFGGMAEVFTSFEGYHHLKGELRLENSAKRILAVAETVMGESDKQYSAKFLLTQPVSADRFKSQVWLKTPHPAVSHLELKADHTFDESAGSLSTALKGTFNQYSLQTGVSGERGGDGVVVRVLEGTAFLKASLPQGVGQDFRLTFNHRDSGGRYTSQALADVNGDQYSVTSEADYTKVHYLITTSGEVVVRAPQMTSPVTLSWTHKNSLHEVTSSMAVQYPPYNQRVQLDVEGTVNIVTKQYQAQVQLRGPWKENGGNYTSKLNVDFHDEPSGFNLTTNLELDNDTYKLYTGQKQTRTRHEISQSLEMSRYPQYNYRTTYSLTGADFPVAWSLETQMAEKTVVEFSVAVDKPRENKYTSSSRLILDLEDVQQKVIVNARHVKKEQGQWVNSGDVEYQPGKSVSFKLVVDVEEDKKLVSLDVDTPLEEVETIRFEYSHSGKVEEDFVASCSLAVSPVFDTATAEVSWSRADRFRADLHLGLPVEDLRYLEVKTESWKEGDKRHSTLELDYPRRQTYKLDTVYSCDFPKSYELKVKLETPRAELPSLLVHVKHQTVGSETSALYKLASPAMPYDELSVSFSQKLTGASVTSEIVTVIGSGNVWTTSTDLSWGTEIDGSFSVENNGKGRHKFAVVLGHKGHTWEDFRTKASVRMNGDRLATEVTYSNKDGREGSFMLATPDKDLDYFRTTFFHKLTEDKFEGRYSVQYGELSKPYELGLMTTFSNDTVAFSTDFKTPHSEDLAIEIGFARLQSVKLLGKYGSGNKISVLVKYGIDKDIWDVGGDFEYMVNGSGRNMAFLFKRDGPLDNLQCSSTAKYMGKEVTVDLHFRDGDQKSGRVNVSTSFQDYTNLAAAFNHSGNDEKFQTNVYLKYKDDKEAKGSVDFQRKQRKRFEITSTLNLPYEDFRENKLTCKLVNRKNKVSVDGSLKLGSSPAITGNLEFLDNSKLTASVKGPYRDFETFSLTGTYDEADKRLEGDARVQLRKGDPITAIYNVRAGIWPVMVNVKAQTPFPGWESVELASTHDGVLTDFTSSHALTSDFLGTVRSELVWSYTSPSVLSGLWTLTSRLEGAQNLKLSLRNDDAGFNEYTSRLVLGWELLKEIVVDATVELPPNEASSRYKGNLAMTTPLPEVSQLSLSFDHSHDARLREDTVVALFNDRKYLDADFSYTVADRRVGRVEFREPRPMEFLLGGTTSDTAVEGELKLNWDKRDPIMNVHLKGDYADRGDRLGSDTSMKVWAIHPVRTMGVEYLMKKSSKEFQSDFLLTWDKSAGHTLSYVISWANRTSRYSSAYDAVVKVGVPMRSVQVEGAFSDTGRTRAAEGSVMWDADRDKSMKLGVKGQVDRRGDTNQLQLGLDMPFISKEYTVTTESTLNNANSLLDARTEFSYSPDPRQTLVVTTRLDDLSFGQEATVNYSLALGVVHAMTDVDIHLTTHVGSSPGRNSASSSMVYKMSSGSKDKKTLSLRGDLDRLRRKMEVEMRSPVKDFSLEAQVSGERSYDVKLVSLNDGQRYTFANILIEPETRSLQTTLWYDKETPDKSLKFSGHLINDRLLQTELYRMGSDGQRESETLMTVRLNSSQVMHTRFNWRPGMLTDLQQYIGGQLAVFSQVSSQSVQHVAGTVGREVTIKYQAIMQEVKEEARPLFDHFQREMESLQKDLDSMQTGLRRFYLQNSLHVQDINKVINVMLKTLVDGLQGLGFKFQLLQAQWQQDMAQLMEGLGQYPLAQAYAQLVSDFVGGLKNSRVILQQALQQLSLQVSKFSDVTYQRYLIMSRQIDRKLKGYTAALRTSPHYQGLSRLGSQLSSGNYQELAQAANDRLLSHLDELGLKEPYVAMMTKSKKVIADQFHDIVQRPEFQQIYVIASEVYQQGVWAYHYWQVEQNVQLAVGQVLKLAKDVTLLEITRIKDAVVDLDRSRIIVFDPQHGELQFELYLPVTLKSLAEPPDMRVGKYVNRVRAWVTTYIPSPRHSLWTAINTYLPSTDTDTWLPPFTGHAFVMGDQHMVTFDRRHYNFAGRCSYVLARDMGDDRFTVILHYNNRPRQPQVQSVVVLLRGVAIEVDRENKVKVNDKGTELPFFSGVISAVRHQSIVRVQDGQALTVEIDSARGIYSVAISGWYHGRTAGLLGTYDNEPFNDLTDSNHQITEDVEAFTNSWEVGRRYCRSRNLADVEEMDEEDGVVTECRKFLTDSSSYFSPCFGQVDAEELVWTCVSHARTAGVSVQEAQCRAGQHYRYMCGRLGIAVSTPSQCVMCQLPHDQGSFSAGVSKEVEARVDDLGADVVFVVEESSCNSWAQRSLASLATQLAQALTAKGLTDNRFGMVSYAGNGSQDLQLVHTIEGQVFGDPGNFLKAAENLRLTYPSQRGDVEAALQKAAQYPFRAGVAKVLVLLPCSACSGDLYVLGQVLSSYGFQLHVINEQNFALGGDDSDGADDDKGGVRIYGVDSSKAHTQKSAARRAAEIYGKLSPPEGSCARLALATNGSVFDSAHMQARGRIQRDFLESFAARGALGARTPDCERCSCHDDGTGRGHLVCQLCDHDHAWMWNHIPRWLQSSSTSVMGVFNDLHHQLVTSLEVPEVVQGA